MDSSYGSVDGLCTPSKGDVAEKDQSGEEMSPGYLGCQSFHQTHERTGLC